MATKKSTRKLFDRSKLKKYDFPVEEVPRYRADDPRVDECIAEQRPVVIVNSNVIRSAMGWDLDYLEKNMPETVCPVLISSSNNFKYFRSDDDDLPASGDKKSSKELKRFVPPTKTVNMKVAEFHKRLKEWKEGDDKLYLQLALNSTVGPAIVQQFVAFKWDWIYQKSKIGSWGRLTSNLLFIGMGGNVTPCHFDEQENLFAQVKGYKRCILFSPEQFECLYPYPVFHPHDRQSQVDFNKPDYQRFPKFKEAKGLEAIVGPGDVLYIPMYWWHHIESSQDDPYTVSINFWHKAGPSENIVYPLKGHQKVAIMRNVEKMLKDALGDPDEVGPLLRTLVLGRYTE